jgi:hypothetical protein
MDSLLLAVLILLGHSTSQPSAAVEAGRCTSQALVGTWQLVQGKVGDQETPVGPSKPIETKLLTPTHFVVFQHDPAKKNVVSWVHGGPYELTGDTYTESIAYGFGEPFDAVNGQKVQFQCRMEGDKWRISGKFADGTALDETWVRAPKP